MTQHAGGFRRSFRRMQLRVERVKLGVKRRLGLFEPPEILAYRSHGRGDRLRVIARVVERTGVRHGDEGDGLVRNALRTLRRFESDEIPGARVRASFNGVTAEDVADHEGFIALVIEPEQEVPGGWHEVRLEIVSSMAGGEGSAATAEVLVPPTAPDFAVISDIDDTVIRTAATDKLTQLRILLAHNARTHAAMPGVAPLYRALEAGPGGRGGADSNPFFYISMSGWGLYDLFEEFLDHRELPPGAMFLQDVAITEPKSPELGSPDHKRASITRLIEDYPGMDFVLIGDSGQDDPETYRDIVREHPDRIRAVLLRDVTPPSRDREVRRVVEEMLGLGVDTAAAESSVSLARAAADFGLIHHDAIADVRRGMIEEEVD